MNSTITDKQRYLFNQDVSMADIDSAIRTLKAHGILAEAKPGVHYFVGDEVISPRTLVDRAEKGYYAKGANEGPTTTEVEVPSHKGRSVSVLGERLVDSDTNKRGRKRVRNSNNGSGAGEGDGGLRTRTSSVSRKKTAPVRKLRTGVSKSKGDNSTDKASLAGKVGRKVNRKKPGRARRHS